MAQLASGGVAACISFRSFGIARAGDAQRMHSASLGSLYLIRAARCPPWVRGRLQGSLDSLDAALPVGIGVAGRWPTAVGS